MTMLERARAEGIDPELLVGWVETGTRLTRITASGSVVSIESNLSWAVFAAGVYSLDVFEIKSPADLDDYVAKNHGGWAPAPIGYVPAPPEVKSDAV